MIDDYKLLISILESSFDGIYITDNEGLTLYVNSAYERITGFTKNEVVNKNIKQLIADNMFSDSAVLKVLESKTTESITHTYVTGKEALATCTPVLDENGDIFRVVCNVRDISELIQLRKELDEALKLTSMYQHELHKLQQQTKEFGELVIRSSKMMEVLDIASRAAKYDSTVLLTGESGVGKEEIAKYLHEQSHRNHKPFVKINCAAVPSALIESELFGYREGSFTGARKEGKLGLFEIADGGTILLDEVGELPLDVQPKILRVLQSGEIFPIGDKSSKTVDVRVIAISNKNLYHQVDIGEFREDLLFRLNVVPIEVPPLRERKEEIAPLIHKFLRKLNVQYDVKKSIEAKVISSLVSYSWPGNVRELENMVEYLFVVSNEQKITVKHLPKSMGSLLEDSTSSIEQDSLGKVLEKTEKDILLSTYREEGSIRKAAIRLNISPATMSRKMKKHNISVT